MDDPHGREFWSTFGEDGVGVFWGIDGDPFEALPATMRRLLVAYTISVADAPERERKLRLTEINRLPRAERLNRLCMLATASPSRSPSPRSRVPLANEGSPDELLDPPSPGANSSPAC